LSEILAHGLLWLDVLRDYHGSIRSHNFRRFVTEGGLISFGIDQAALYRLAASYVDRILKGEKPADLPVQAPTKYETVRNIKTLPKHSAWKYRRVCLPVLTRYPMKLSLHLLTSLHGTSRHLGAAVKFGRFQTKADMSRHTRSRPRFRMPHKRHRRITPRRAGLEEHKKPSFYLIDWI
jgi:hypothetical protein